MLTNLIIQGDHVPTQTLKQIAKLCAVDAIEAINQQAFRLVNADNSNQAAIAELCAAAKLDFGFIPFHRHLNDFKLVVMDMDSTLITIECIDEIADMIGIKPEVAAITESAMRGEIVFAESLTRRVALLAGLDASALERVYEERLRLTPGAETMLTTLQQRGIKTLLVSGGFTFFTERLQSRLNLDYSASNTLEIIDGKLTGRVLGNILDAQGKADWLNKVREELGLAQKQVIAIGDGANDLLMMAQAGVSVAYHAKPVVRQQASYALNYNDLSAVLPLLGKL
ncbi:phosphoserine phosphatase SerB [Sulfuriferula thiophila]|uniref:phosphoserine phosphatase SerB n=1 Tax=Sulfuriferula thiophila TaxID=1781211 RepID=UPI000F60E2C6|nr:phosphoserine phosphatase SerB [Sulfuriferula thiophila]